MPEFKCGYCREPTPVPEGIKILWSCVGTKKYMVCPDCHTLMVHFRSNNLSNFKELMELVNEKDKGKDKT